MSYPASYTDGTHWHMTQPHFPDATRDSDELDREVKEHLARCAQCQRATATGTPRGFGQRTHMCRVYLTIVGHYAPGEGTLHDT